MTHVSIQVFYYNKPLPRVCFWIALRFQYKHIPITSVWSISKHTLLSVSTQALHTKLKCNLATVLMLKALQTFMVKYVIFPVLFLNPIYITICQTDDNKGKYFLMKRFLLVDKKL